MINDFNIDYINIINFCINIAKCCFIFQNESSKLIEDWLADIGTCLSQVSIFFLILIIYCHKKWKI